MTNDTDTDTEFANCSMCGQCEVVEITGGSAGFLEYEHSCSECGEPICSDCWKKCPEDDAGDKVCEECAR